MVGKDGCFHLSYSDTEFSSKKSGEDDGKFLSDPDHAHTLTHSNAVIVKFDGQWVASSSQNFLFVIGRKYYNTRRRMLPSKFSPSE